MVCRLWDAATGKMRHELRGHEEKTPHHFPSMLYACTFSPDGKLRRDRRQGRPRRRLGRRRRASRPPRSRRRSCTPGTRCSGGTRSAASARWPSRPTARGSPSAASGKIGNIDHLEGKARVEVFDWRKAERTHEFPGETFKGLVERLVFLPDGDRLLAVGGANDGFLMLLDLKTKAVSLQEKAPTHVHDAALGDTPDIVFTAAHGKIAAYEMKAAAPVG